MDGETQGSETGNTTKDIPQAHLNFRLDGGILTELHASLWWGHGELHTPCILNDLSRRQV